MMHDISEHFAKTVAHAECDEVGLLLRFSDGTQIKVCDSLQICCERRYITCDDDLGRIIGGQLAYIETKPVGDIEAESGDVHEQVFVDVVTTSGTITFTTHNEHNGRYGGFVLAINEEA